jgi:hypothetical protein
MEKYKRFAPRIFMFIPLNENMFKDFFLAIKLDLQYTVLYNLAHICNLYEDPN